MKRLLYLIPLLWCAMAYAQCNPPNYVGPPSYPCGSTGTANPGLVNFMFNSTVPTGTVNTSGTAVSWASGPNFSTGWTGFLTIGVTEYTISSCASTTACTLTGSAGTQTGAVYNKPDLCSGGCQNDVEQDSTIPGHVDGTLLITRVTDGPNTFQGRSVTSPTITGGDEDHMWSYPNGKYVFAVESGLMQVWEVNPNNKGVVNTSGTAVTWVSGTMFNTNWTGLIVIGTTSYTISSCSSTTSCTLTGSAGTQTGAAYNRGVQVVNAGCTPLTLTEGAAFSSSWLSDQNFYYFTDGSQAGSEITKGALTGTGCSLAFAAPTNVVDIMGTDVCPGIAAAPFAMNWKSLLTVTKDDDEFVFSTAAGGQGSADWVIAWSRTKGCSTANFATGTVYGWCTSACGSATALGTFPSGASNCWGTHGSDGTYGIHATIGSFDGTYVEVTPGYSLTYPSQGGCVGIGSTQAGYPFWHIGTLGNQWCANNDAGTSYWCAAHSTFGINTYFSPSYHGWTTRPASDVTAYTAFSDGSYNNGHWGEPHNNNGTYDDTLPLIGANYDASTGSGCSGPYSSAVYCPTYLGGINGGNAVYVAFPYAGYPPNHVSVITHTGSCGDVAPHCNDGIADPFAVGVGTGVPSPKGDMYSWASGMWHNTGLDKGGLPRSDLYVVYLGAPAALVNSGSGLSGTAQISGTAVLQ